MMRLSHKFKYVRLSATVECRSLAYCIKPQFDRACSELDELLSVTQNLALEITLKKLLKLTDKLVGFNI